MIDSINMLGTAWANYFGALVVQNTVFLLAVLLVLALAQNAPARIKYLFALIGLCKLALPPLFPASFFDFFLGEAASGAGEITLGSIEIASTSGSALTSFSFYGLLLGLWLFAVLIFIALPIISTYRLKKTLKGSASVTGGALQRTLRGKNVQIYQTNRIQLPLCFGVRKNRIYLPAFWSYWSPACRRMVLQHELAHISRKDGIIQIVQYIIQALYFFHPLVWVLNARINDYREMACDDEAIAFSNISAMEYSRYLVTLAEKVVERGLGCASASALIRRKNKLMKRVDYQMKESTMKHISKKKAGMIYVFLLALMLPLSWYCTQDTQEDGSALPTQPGGTSAAAGGESYATDDWDNRPEPIGGMMAIQKNLVYPEIARKAGVEGTVMVETVIDAEGNAVDAKVIKSLGENGCDEAALKAVTATKWKPALKDGEPVEVKIAMPILFRLSSNETISIKTEEIMEKLTREWMIELQRNLTYPETARKAGIEGTVMVQATIDEKGNVVATKIVESLDPECDEAAAAALRAVNWSPLIQEDDPKSITFSLPVQFRLSSSK